MAQSPGPLPSKNTSSLKKVHASHAQPVAAGAASAAGAAGAVGAAGAAAGAEPHAELYAHPDHDEPLSMFDSEDLLPEGVFLLLCFGGGEGTQPTALRVWVGGESDFADERERDLLELGGGFLTAKGLPADLPAAVHFESEEPEDFWAFFVNG